MSDVAVDYRPKWNKEGYDGYQGGLGVADNPYAMCGSDYEEWRDGWHKAWREDQKKHEGQ